MIVELPADNFLDRLVAGAGAANRPLLRCDDTAAGDGLGPRHTLERYNGRKSPALVAILSQRAGTPRAPSSMSRCYLVHHPATGRAGRRRACGQNAVGPPPTKVRHSPQSSTTVSGTVVGMPTVCRLITSTTVRGAPVRVMVWALVMPLGPPSTATAALVGPTGPVPIVIERMAPQPAVTITRKRPSPVAWV